MPKKLTHSEDKFVNRDRVNEILRERRRKKLGRPTNQEELADMLHLWGGGKSSVSRGLRDTPLDPKTVQEMAAVLGVRAEYILGEDKYKTEREKTRSELVNPEKDPRNDPSNTLAGVLLKALGYELWGVYLEHWPDKVPVRDRLLELSEALNRGEKVPKTSTGLMKLMFEEDDFDEWALPSWLLAYLESPRVYEYRVRDERTGKLLLDRDHVFIHERNMRALENQIKLTVRNFAEGWEGAGSHWPSDPDFDFDRHSPKRIK